MTGIEKKELNLYDNKYLDEINKLSYKLPNTRDKYNKELKKINKKTINHIREERDRSLKQIYDYLNKPLNISADKYEISGNVDETNGDISLINSGKRGEIGISINKIDDDISYSLFGTKKWGEENRNGKVSITNTTILHSNNTNLDTSLIEDTISGRYDKNFKLDKGNIHTTIFGNINLKKPKGENMKIETRIGGEIKGNYNFSDKLSGKAAISGSIDKNNEYLKWRTNLSSGINYNFSDKSYIGINGFYEKGKSYKDSYYKMYGGGIDLKLDKIKLNLNYEKNKDNWGTNLVKKIGLNYDINSATSIYMKYKKTKGPNNHSNNIETGFSHSF